MANYVEEGMCLSLKGDEKIVDAQHIVEGEGLWESHLLVRYRSLLMHTLVALKLFLHVLYDGVLGSSRLEHHEHQLE